MKHLFTKNYVSKLYSKTLACLVFVSLTQLQASLIQLDPYSLTANESISSEWTQDSTIRTYKPIDVAEILANQVPSVANIRKGPLAGDLLLRGLGKDNVLVTLDGGQICGACPNRMDPPAFHVSSQQIDRITLVRGPFDVESGATVGGVIRIESAASEPFNQAAGSFYAGSYNSYAAHASANLFSSQIRARGGLYHQRGDVYKDGDGRRFTDAPTGNAAYQNHRKSGKAYSVTGGEVKLSLHPTESSQFNVNVGYNNAQDVFYPGLSMDGIRDTSKRLGIAYQSSPNHALADHWSLFFSISEVEHLMTDEFRVSSISAAPWIARGYMMKTDADTRFWSTGLKASQSFDSWDIRYGSTYSEREWNAENQIMNARNAMLPNVVTRNLGTWANAKTQYANWHINAGARIDFSNSRARSDISYVHTQLGTGTNRKTDVLPAGYVSAQHALPRNHSVEIGIGHGERLPDPQERYLNLARPNGTNWLGNPDLKPVRNTELQGKISGSQSDVDYSLALFHAWLDNFIYTADRTGTNRISYENIDARLYGLEAQLNWNAHSKLRFESGLAWQRGVKESQPTRNTDRDLGEIPPLKGRVAALLQPNQRLDLLAELHLASAQTHLDSALGEQRIGGYAVTHLKAAWKCTDHIELSGGVDNLFDRTYAVHNAYRRDPFSTGAIVNEPGRFFYTRIALEF